MIIFYLSNQMAGFTPSGYPLRDYDKYTPSGYPLNSGEESDNDWLPARDPSWCAFERRGDIERSSPEEKEQKKLLEKRAKEAGEVLAQLSPRERQYMLASLPAYALESLKEIEGWTEEVHKFEQKVIHHGRVELINKMKRHFQRLFNRQ